MLKDVVEARALPDFHLYLRFEDGVEGTVNVAELVPFTGVFAPLRQPDQFARLEVNQELGTVCWPNGADLDPDVLYATITGEKLPDMGDDASFNRQGHSELPR